MIKKTTNLVIGLLLIFFIQLVSGCVSIRIKDNYRSETFEAMESGTNVIPSPRLERNTSYLFFLLFFMEVDRVPHQLIMSLRDPNFNNENPYKSFVLNELYVEYEDGTRVDFIDESLPEQKRTYLAIKPGESHSNADLSNEIRKRMDFTFYTTGTVYKANGETIPFEVVQEYVYKGKDRSFFTIFDVLKQ